MLREYQTAAIQALRAEIRAGRRRLVLVSPCGSGKTTIAAEMIRSANSMGRRVLFIAHRTILIEQASARLDEEAIPHSIAMGSASRYRNALTTLGSIQTLSRRKLPEFDLAIVDEGHHHSKDSAYTALLDRVKPKATIALTATPRNGMGDSYDGLVVAAQPRELMEQGFLCRYSGFAFLAPDLSGVKTVRGDWDESGLSLAYQKSTVFASVVGKWQQHARGKRTIAFCSSIENAQDVAARFRAVGVGAESLDYRSTKAERDAVFDRFRSGETLVLCNFSLFGEGLDLPMAKCIILARPTKSWILAMQMCGRGLRPWNDETCVFLDHGQVIQAHGLPDQTMSYSLTVSRPKEVVPALRTCKSCFCIWEGAGACPNCGAQPVAVTRTGPETSLAHQEVEIRSVTGLPSRAKQIAMFDEMMSEARRYGSKPGAAIHRFREAFPSAPLPWGRWRKAVDKETKTWR